MKTLILSDESILDIDDIIEWYSKFNIEIVDNFKEKLFLGLKTIENNPTIFQDKYCNVKIHFIEKFPYGIHYIIEEEFIKIIGIFHTSRNPINWFDRI